MRYVAHLAKRFVTSWSRKDVTEDELNSVRLAQRFASLLPGASREHVAGVLLHDIGKIQSNLSTLMRVIATLVGPRTKRLSLYHQHEEIGITMLRHAGSDSEVIAVLNQTCRPEVAAAFRSADNI
jgi:predicted HD phosphohydrolase